VDGTVKEGETVVYNIQVQAYRGSALMTSPDQRHRPTLVSIFSFSVILSQSCSKSLIAPAQVSPSDGNTRGYFTFILCF
jgi:hypothetical protein